MKIKTKHLKIKNRNQQKMKLKNFKQEFHYLLKWTKNSKIRMASPLSLEVIDTVQRYEVALVAS